MDLGARNQPLGGGRGAWRRARGQASSARRHQGDGRASSLGRVNMGTELWRGGRGVDCLEERTIVVLRTAPVRTAMGYVVGYRIGRAQAMMKGGVGHFFVMTSFRHNVCFW